MICLGVLKRVNAILECCTEVRQYVLQLWKITLQCNNSEPHGPFVGMSEQNFNFSCHIKQLFEIKVWVYTFPTQHRLPV